MLNIQNGKIHKGDKIIFGITGSGITLGTALYTFDELPEKIQNKSHNTIKREELPDRQRTIPASSPNDVWVHVAGIGTCIFSGEEEKDGISMLLEASRICIEDSGIKKNDLGMVIHSGIYRDGFISEPAIAAIIAGELDINAGKTSSDSRQTFAFDIINGGLGTLNACYAAIQMIRANKAANVMVATSEVENNRILRPDHLMSIQESGAAMILSPGSQDRKGFGRFVFKYKEKYIGAMNSYATWKDGKNYLSFSRHPNLEKHYIEVIKDAVNEICELEHLSINDFDLVIPPQISGYFVDKLISELGFRNEKVVKLAQGGKNWLTASLPQSLNHSIKNKLVKAGDMILIIEVGSGVQAGCAIYYY
jgi:3-oxoacyl-[acyl-carrier-protein] synthase III